MKQDEIIRMAREIAEYLRDCAGSPVMAAKCDSLCEQIALAEREKEIKRVAEGHGWTQAHWTAYEESIAAAEREACAKVCDEHGFYGAAPAAAIRARSN